MKIKDVEQINALLAERTVVRELITRVERAEAGDFSLMIERGGDGSIRLSEEGTDTAHYTGYPASARFRAKLKALALEELRARRAALEGELAKLGVEMEE